MHFLVTIRFATVITPLLLFASSLSHARAPLAVVLVDKKANATHLAKYDDGGITIEKTYHATLGKVVGDKQITDDKKTPEGVYFLLSKRTPPHLQKKFGVMGFPVDYPNPVDKREGKTGFGIMLHATDDPARLTKNYDSDGCVVVDNHEINEMSRGFTLGLSPMIIFDEMKPEYLKETYKPELKTFFEAWVKAWGEKDLDKYMSGYHPTFQFNGMDIKGYRAYKMSLNKKYERIAVAAKNVRIYNHPKYTVITFGQDYRSWFKGGRQAFQSLGTKVIYVKEDLQGHFRIVHEDFNHLQEN